MPRLDNTPPQKVQFYVKTSTFRSNEDAEYAGDALQAAGDEWNKLDLGIEFGRVPDEDTANFALVYRVSPPPQPGQGQTLARAFFPNERNQNIIVFSVAFEGRNKEFIYNFFLHELGHVLGLRHEFAIESEGAGAVQFLGKNDKSVMAYNYPRFPPEIQQSDINGTKKFYELENGYEIGSQPVTDYVLRVR